MLLSVAPLGEFYNCNEDTTVYFDPASGDTHLLSNFAAYLLRQLAVQPMDIEQLITRIAPDIDPQDIPELSRHVPDVIAELAALDVIAEL